MIYQRIQVHRVWRSEFTRLVLFVVLSPISVWLSSTFPQSVVVGSLFSIGDTVFILKLPIFWFIPAFIAIQAMLKIYDVKYTADNKGIESKIGILSLSQTITRIRYEDIRSIDAKQSLSERLLGIGTLEMGTAASAGLEMSFTGIANPIEVQRMIQAERDARLRKSSSTQHNRDYERAVAAGAE